MYGGQSGEFVSAYWCLKGQFRTLHNSRESFKRGVYCFHVDIHTVLACSFFFVIVYCIFFSLDKGKQNLLITGHWHRCWSLDRHQRVQLCQETVCMFVILVGKDSLLMNHCKDRFPRKLQQNVFSTPPVCPAFATTL